MKHNTAAERQAELQRAKDSMKDWTRQGRTWDYNVLCRLISDKPSRLALLAELRRKHFLITNAPTNEEHTDEQPTTSSAAHQAPVVASASREQRSSEETSSSGSNSDAGDPMWQKDTAQPQTTLRVRMQQTGLYEKFPREAALLTGFKKHLTDNLQVPNCQQEVDNVSRMLRYMQPSGDEVNIGFLLKSTETQDFLNRLKGVQMGPATIINYIKNMIRFVQYVKTRLDLAAEDTDFHRKCQAYIELLNTLRKPVAKSLSRDTCKKRYDRFINNKVTLHDCQKVLRVSKNDMLGIYGKLLEKQRVTNEEKTLFRYYCEAILILKHFQRPGAVEGLTTEEWVNKRTVDGRVCVGVSRHKTSTMQIATFALTEEEAAMLDTYYLEIRKVHVEKPGDDDGRFFLSKSGRPIRSATNDVRRLHEHYKVTNVTSQEVRKVAETEASVAFSEEQKSAAAHYMAHSNAVANAHYRMRTLDSVVATANLLSSLASSSSDESGGDASHRGQKRCRGTAEVEGKDFAAFLQQFPVAVSGQPPTKRQRTDAGFASDRSLYDKWRIMQFGQREQYLLSKTSRRPPTVRRIAKVIEDEGWTNNCPSPEDVLKKWKPASKVQVESDPDIKRRVAKQKWSGLAIKDFGGGKGQGVVATRDFPTGSILCDYHGKEITGAEGRSMMESMQDEMGYLFFFKAGEQDLCIDAQTFPCECHPTLDTVGRRINHSKRHFNVKPLHCRIQLGDSERNVILFKAVRDISVDEEIRFHYGSCSY